MCRAEDGGLVMRFVRLGLWPVACALLAVSPAQAQFAVDANTLALWHFDDGAGLTAVDAGTNGFDLDLARYPSDGSSGAVLPTWTQHGCFGGALHFTTGDDYTYGGYASVTAPFVFAQNHLSTELWVATTSSQPAYLLVIGFVQFEVLIQGNGTVYTNVGDGNNWSNPVISAAKVNDGLWHYVAVTYDGAQVRLFVDGQPDGAVAFSGTIGTITYPTVVGGRPANDFLTGTIDEVRISDVARSASAISNTWNQLSVLCPEPARAEGSCLALTILFLLRRKRTQPAV